MSVHYYAEVVGERLGLKKGTASEEGPCEVAIAVWWESTLAGLWVEEAQQMRYRSHMKCGYHVAFDN